ncbi:MAG: hypothetical protein JNL85_09850 [Rubrivivax sp.]|nr:hypothetical protein [Rubrivivax sp.]
MNAWDSVFLALGGNALMLAALAWLSRSFLSHTLTKDVERFKSQLTAEAAVASARLTHDLHLVAQEHQVLVSKLHEKRAEVVAEVYGLLVEAHWACQDFASLVEWVGEPPKKEKYSVAMNKAAEFYRYFDKNRIYLPAGLCSQLEDFLRAMRGVVIDFGVHTRKDESGLHNEALERKYEAWTRAAKYFDSEAPKARAALEDALRAIVGPPPRQAAALSS